jgi:hypothetical protein
MCVDIHAQGRLTAEQVIAFDEETASQLQQSLANGEWHKRYRIITHIPPCLSACLAGSSKRRTPPALCNLINPHLRVRGMPPIAQLRNFARMTSSRVLFLSVTRTGASASRLRVR